MRSGSKADAHERLCAVSVDLDEVPCYTAIHGLTQLPEASRHAVYRHALPRLAELFAQLEVPATFFAIGRDLVHQHAHDALRALAQAGHEIGNHSQDHWYDLTQHSRAEMRAQVADAAHNIERATGSAPRGFRAPGYTITDELFAVLQELGVVYDSSVFPCPAYYGLKVAAIRSYQLRGRPTHSVVDHPRVLSAPTEPYRIGTPYTRRGTGLLELPIGVTRTVTGRLPFIGTSVIMAGRRGASLLCRAMTGRRLINLELHGIDAADAQLDGLTALQRAQPDLRMSARDKLAVLEHTLLELRAAGYRFVTLETAARAFS
ncbi:MAG: hypothetical protein RL701_78 [Pseudomonadota bacterium]|jgi:peptidoglycan/xylan/chitin deacetylase (PgdA/CDA1 family)